MSNYKYHCKYLKTMGYGKDSRIQYKTCEYTIRAISKDNRKNHMVAWVKGPHMVGINLLDIPTRKVNEDIDLIRPHFKVNKVEAHFLDKYTDFLKYNDWYIGTISTLGHKTCFSMFPKPLAYISKELDDLDCNTEFIKNYRGINEDLMDKANVYAKSLDYSKAKRNLELKMNEEQLNGTKRICTN